MQSIKFPKFPKLRGEEAIMALSEFINELEEQRGKELTDKQTTALIKLANRLILSIKIEIQSGTSGKDITTAHMMNSVDPLLWRPISPFNQSHRTLL